MNYLLLSVGRRCELIKDFRQSLPLGSVIVATDNSKYAPALYMADKSYLVPRIDSPGYIDLILDICQKEQISAVLTLIDPEIELIAKNRDRFLAVGVQPLVPYAQTAARCYDKFLMYQFLVSNGINTVATWGTLEDFDRSFHEGKVSFPVFVKPRTGSGSVGARKVDTYENLCLAVKRDPSLIIQEYMDCIDLDADVYIDTISHRAVSAFLKRKIESRIGGANKTISFKDDKLFSFICEIVSAMRFCGPVDMDFFCKDGEYYLSEVNPRFGGAYLHAYGAGVDFIKLIENNLNGVTNEPSFGDYDEGVVMMMYDSVVICRPDEVVE